MIPVVTQSSSTTNRRRVLISCSKPNGNFIIPRTRTTSTTTTSTSIFATWSDARAVQEYQQFLASGKSELIQEPDGPSVIIRPDETSSSSSSELFLLSDALVRMGMKDDVVLTPGQELPTELEGRTSYPIYITLPPFQLEHFLKTLPPSYKERNEDFVFFSGGLRYGNIEDLLKTYGYCRDSMTQVLISGIKVYPPPSTRIEDLTVSLGISASGEEKVAGECAACGKWLGAIAQVWENEQQRYRRRYVVFLCSHTLFAMLLLWDFFVVDRDLRRTMFGVRLGLTENGDVSW